MTTEVRADVARHAVHSRREIRTLSIEAMVERIDRCVRTRSPVDVTTPAATIIAVRARSMSEAEVMSASCARFNESRRECNARCSGECRSVSTPPPREPRRALYIHQIKIIRQASKTHDSRGSLNRRCAPRYREVEFRLGNHGSGPKCVRARILRSELSKILASVLAMDSFLTSATSDGGAQTRFDAFVTESYTVASSPYKTNASPRARLKSAI